MNLELRDVRINRKRIGVIYASLYDEQNHLVISATLDYIIRECMKRGYTIKNLPTATLQVLEIVAEENLVKGI